MQDKTAVFWHMLECTWSFRLPTTNFMDQWFLVKYDYFCENVCHELFFGEICKIEWLFPGIW